MLFQEILNHALVLVVKEKQFWNKITSETIKTAKCWKKISENKTNNFA